MMKKLKNDVIKLLSSVIVLFLVFSTFTPCFTVTARAESTASIDVSFCSGGDKIGDNYIWTAETSSAGHRFIFRIDYSLSGEGNLARGDVKITIPKHILKSREQLASGSSEYADVCELSVPHESQATDKTEFVYVEEENDIVIYNWKEGMSAGQKGYHEVYYETSESTFEYRDMTLSDSFSASLSFTSGGSTINKNSTSIRVGINTSAEVSSTKVISNSPTLYKTWNDSWGTRPDDADDYYYLIWTLCTDVKHVTQPYKLMVESTVSSTYGDNVEVVGYKMSGSNIFSNINYQENIRKGPLYYSSVDTATSFYRYDYILTRHPKETFKSIVHYVIDGVETVTVTPSDMEDNPTSASSSDYFSYDRTYIPPGGSFQSYNSGNSNWTIRHGNRWDIANYGLNDLQDGVVQYLDKNIKYEVELWGYPSPWTLPDGKTSNDIESYGTEKVTYILTDDEFFINDKSEEISDGEIQIDDAAKQLGYQDYEIMYVNYSYRLEDRIFDWDDMKFVSSSLTYTDNDVLKFEAKFGSDSDWKEVGSYNFKTQKADFDSDYVKSLDKNKITFQENCIGYRISVSNSHFYTYICATPYLKLKNSTYVMEQINQKERIHLTNISHANVLDKDGNEIFNIDRLARDFVIGAKKTSAIKKTVTSTSQNKADKYLDISWKVEMKETYMTNEGVEYVYQDCGTYYDLLPSSSSIDTSTVAVMNEDGYLSNSAFDVSTIMNYHNSGRTLLVVNIKEQFKKSTLMYSTTHTWENIKDFGVKTLNSVAFETGNDVIGNGLPDNGGSITDKNLLSDLDPYTNDRKFIYTQYIYYINILISATTGLRKQVQSAESTYFDEEATVHPSEEYVYKLRYHTDSNAHAKDIVLYDSLENCTAGGKSSDWRGTLSSIDVSQAVSMGASPIIYYSKIENLKIDNHYDLNDSIDGEKVWLTESEIGDISKATAIAIDLSRDSSGDEFVLASDKSVSVFLYMKSPESVDSNNSDPVAFNDVYIANNVVDDLGEERWGIIKHEYTKAHFRVVSSFGIYKSDSTDFNTPVKNVSFCLEGTSDYGTGVYKILVTDKFGHVDYKNIEKGTYKLYEYESNPDYHAITEFISVTITQYGTVKINGSVLEDYYYNITNIPRIHTDVKFYKKDLVDTRKGINGVKFKLSGRSDYGNDILMYAESNMSGLVSFRNVELGKYILVETEGVDGYISNDNQYTVVVSEEGTFSIIGSTTEANGNIAVYNEPYHTIVIQKVTYENNLPLGNAKFALKGTSDYGNYMYIETSSNSRDGSVYFNGLEPGAYVLEEISAPEGYLKDDGKYPVIIDNKGNYEINGLEKNKQNIYIIKNKENGTVTVDKKWVDNLSDDERPTPTIHLKAYLSDSKVYFGNNYLYQLIKVSSSQIQSFTKCDEFNGTPVTEELLNELEVSGDISSLTRIDDGSTGFKIYTWSTAANPYDYNWWSDALNVYVTNPITFNKLSACTDLDLSGVNFSKMKATDYTVGLGIAIRSGVYGSSIYSNKRVPGEQYKQMLFSGCNVLQNLNLSGCDLSKLGKNMSYAFYSVTSLKNINLSNADMSQVTSMYYMFSDCKELQTVNLSNINAYNNTDISRMFMDCYKLQSVYFENFDTSCVTDMACLFRECRTLTSVDLSSFDTSHVIDMNRMFDCCYKLSDINISNFKTTSVANMCYMFCNCYELESIDLSNFDTSSVMNMFGMFQQDKTNKLSSLNLSSFNVSKVQSMRQMFKGCNMLEELDLSSFYGIGSTDVLNMFQGCQKLETIYSSTTWSQVKQSDSMFYGCISLNGGNGKPFSSSDISARNANIDTGYFTYKEPPEQYVSLLQQETGSLTITNTIVSKNKSVRDTKLYFAVDIINGISVNEYLDFVSIDREPVEIGDNYMVFELSNGESVTLAHLPNLVSVGITLFSDYDVSIFDQKLVSYEFGIGTGYVWGSFNTSEYNKIARPTRTATESYELSSFVILNNDNFVISEGFENGFTDVTINSSNHIMVSNLLVDKSLDEFESDDVSEWVEYCSNDKDRCEIDKSVGGNEWTYTFTGLDPRFPYYAWEEETGLSEYNISNLEGNPVSVVDGKATITNTAKFNPPTLTYGSLTVTKTVAALDETITVTDEDKHRIFNFTITLTDSEGKSLSGTDIYGDTVFRDGVARFNLAHDSSVTFTNIPTGYKYKIEEKDEDGFDVTYQNARGDIIAYDVVIASVINTKNYLDPESPVNTSFVLKKELSGNFEVSSDKFDFHVMLEGLDKGKEYSYKIESSDTPVKKYKADSYGGASINLQLSNGESAEFLEIPVGSKYRITEDAGAYTSSYEITDSQENLDNKGKSISLNRDYNKTENEVLSTALETADKDEIITVKFTNVKFACEDLVLKKEVENSTGSNSDSFGFSVELSNLNSNEKLRTTLGTFIADIYGAITIDFYMLDGDEVIFYNLPVGTHYRVTESESPYISSYKIVDSNALGKVVSASNSNSVAKQSLSTQEEIVNEGEKATVTFSNKKMARDVKITNLVDMTYGNIPVETYKNQMFDFVIALNGLDPNTGYICEYSEVDVSATASEKVFSKEDGSLEFNFQLRDGQSMTIRNLPKDATYQIAELAADDYVSSYTVNCSTTAYVKKAQEANTAKNMSIQTEPEKVDVDDQYDDLDVNFVFTNTSFFESYILPNSGMDNQIPFLLVTLFGFVFFSVVYLLINTKGGNVKANNSLQK